MIKQGKNWVGYVCITSIGKERQKALLPLKTFSGLLGQLWARIWRAQGFWPIILCQATPMRVSTGLCRAQIFWHLASSFWAVSLLRRIHKSSEKLSPIVRHAQLIVSSEVRQERPILFCLLLPSGRYGRVLLIFRVFLLHAVALFKVFLLLIH